MKNNHITKIILSLVLLFNITVVYAEGLIMTRTKQNFPEAMLKLQETIKDVGYKVSRVQRIDIGLTKSGYATDKYRVVFFGKKKEIKDISNKYPHLIPHIPWKISIFAEQQDTLLVTADPMQFSHSKYPGANKYLLKWKKDIQKIMNIIRNSE